MQTLGMQVRGAPRASLFCWPSNDKVGEVIFSDALIFFVFQLGYSLPNKGARIATKLLLWLAAYTFFQAGTRKLFRFDILVRCVSMQERDGGADVSWCAVVG